MIDMDSISFHRPDLRNHCGAKHAHQFLIASQMDFLLPLPVQ
jgi:hypothetical protein